MDVMRERFNSKILNVLANKKGNVVFLTKKKYDDLLVKVSNSKSKSRGKKPEDYHRLKRYDIMKVDNVEKLIFPVSKHNSNIRFYVNFEELFIVIHEAHLSTGHGGRNKMLKELQKKYKNVTIEAVMIYLNLCESCQKKSKVTRKRPLVSQEINSRCQIDLIDMQSQPDNDFKFILVYQDSLTKFVQLRALKSKHAKEIANHLIDIFTIFGAPNVVQSDNGLEFRNEIVEEACVIWPDLKIVHEKPEGSVDRRFGGNQDIENVLSSWLESNKTRKWSEGLRFVQLMKNRTFHEDIKSTPYEAMFGKPLKIGLKTSFPKESIKSIKSEEEHQSLGETDNNESDKANSETEDDSNMKDNLLIDDCSAVHFLIKEEKEEIQTDEY